jgi:hypothetical protein
MTSFMPILHAFRALAFALVDKVGGGTGIGNT